MDTNSAKFKIGAAKALVVDDEVNMRSTIGTVLKDAGFPYPEGAATGEEALEMLAKDEHTFQVVILDSELPGLSGEETLEQIRNSAEVKNNNVPIIMMTGLASQDELMAFAKHKIAGYLPKPIIPAALHKSMLRAIGVDK